MFEALVVTLREGVEAALVVAIIVAFLRREGYDRYLPAVFWGIGTATLATLAGAYFLYRAALNEEVFEGLLYLGSAVLVGSMTVWMIRHSHGLSGEMKGSLARILSRPEARSVFAGIFLFTFLMVFREGVETALFLSALSLSTSGLAALLGVVIGLGAAITFGVLFVRGSLRVDLGRFFRITGIALAIFIVQLLVNGYHELSEAGWVPANATTMATVGPLVRNELFFVVAVLVLPLLLLLVPGSVRPEPAAGATGAEARLAQAAGRRQRRARTLGGTLGVAILAALSLGFVYTRPPAALSAATTVVPAADGLVHIPLASFHGTVLRRFVATIGGHSVRFIAVPLTDPAAPGPLTIATAFDACEICGARGYVQDGGNVTCLHCGSAIYPPSIGRTGGCNPVPLPSRIAAGELLLAARDLAAGAPIFTANAHAAMAM